MLPRHPGSPGTSTIKATAIQVHQSTATRGPVTAHVFKKARAPPPLEPAVCLNSGARRPDGRWSGVVDVERVPPAQVTTIKLFIVTRGYNINKINKNASGGGGPSRPLLPKLVRPVG